MVDTITNNLAKNNPFWRQVVSWEGRPTICLYVKLLCTKKILCYGVSVSWSAFSDYFKMGETPRRWCSHITRRFICCCALAEIYLREPMKTDTKNIVALHLVVHNIPGMTGLLDVTKEHWKSCPIK
jgi:hypothetical protein